MADHSNLLLPTNFFLFKFFWYTSSCFTHFQGFDCSFSYIQNMADHSDSGHSDSDDSDVIFVAEYKIRKSGREKKNVWSSKRMADFTPSQRKRRKDGKQHVRFGAPWPPMRHTQILEPLDDREDIDAAALQKQFTLIMKTSNKLPEDVLSFDDWLKHHEVDEE